MTAAESTDLEAGIRPLCPCNGWRAAGTAAGWPECRGPLPILRARGGVGPYDRPQWADHLYRLRRPDGRWCYVAEPYALAVLAYLAAHGFAVAVTAWRARHYPGHTLAVEITAPERMP